MEKGYKRKQYLAGMRGAIPVILGFVPVGIAYAGMARAAGFTAAQTCGMSLSVFAGASQMLATENYAAGAGIVAMILTTFILNLRHLIMSVCVAERMREGSLPVRLLAAFGVTDESFAIFTTQQEARCTVWFFLGLMTVTYSSWNVGTFIGAVVYDFLPAIVTASLAASLYAMFIGLLVPNLRGNWKLAALVALTAVCNTLLRLLAPGSSGWGSWSLIISTLVCAFVGVFFVDLDEGEKEARHDNA